MIVLNIFSLSEISISEFIESMQPIRSFSQSVPKKNHYHSQDNLSPKVTVVESKIENSSNQQGADVSESNDASLISHDIPIPKSDLKRFSLSSCLPITNNQAGQNSWLKISSYKVLSDCLQENCPKIKVSSYEFLPSSSNSAPIQILNNIDSYTMSPSELLKLDCTNGYIYFSSTSGDGDDGGVSYVVRYDLISGKEYSLNFLEFDLPSDRYLILASSRTFDQFMYNDGNPKPEPLPIKIEIRSCEDRKKMMTECQLKKIVKFELTQLKSNELKGISGAITKIVSVTKDQFSLYGKEIKYLNCTITSQFDVSCKPNLGYSLKAIP